MELMEEITKTPPREGWLPKNERKKILLLSDDMRLPSGVGCQSREIVLGTCHRFNWAQLGAAVQHPEAGKAIDASTSLSQDVGVEDAFLHIYPNNGYGDHMILRKLIEIEKPDAIMHFTDPRFWGWLYQMEHEIRQQMPLLYFHVWDDTPYPTYNENFYRSCDAIYTNSKLTHNVVRQVWKRDKPEPWQVQYIPYGVDHHIWHKIRDPEEFKGVIETRKQLFGENADKIKFVVLYNNRNIRRKMTSDIILAYQKFLHMLTEEQRKECRLVFHTAPVDENGTDLPAVLRECAPDIEVVFSPKHLPTQELNKIYNNSDVVINLASNEGFGLGTLEAMMSERMIIVNVTGGLQDQVGFTDDDGNWIDPEIHYCKEWGTNSDGRYRKHGEWAIPVFPNNRALIGSPMTPFIFDDRCDWNDAALAIKQVYDLSPEERARRGVLGREYALDPKTGLCAQSMCDRLMTNFDICFKNWKPKKRFELFKV